MESVAPGQSEIESLQPSQAYLTLGRSRNEWCDPLQLLELRNGEQSILDQHQTRRGGLVAKLLVVVADYRPQRTCAYASAKCLRLSPRDNILRCSVRCGPHLKPN